MCRNIKTLFNFEPPVTNEEIRGAAMSEKSSLRVMNAPPRNRAAEAAKARVLAAQQFSPM
jgi:hypothetical protein